MKRLQRLADESGQTIVFAALCMTVLIAFLGLAIDVGHLRFVKHQLQADADAVALAAGREIRVCGVNAQMLSTCPYMTAAAKSALVENEPTYTGTPSNACGGSLPATSSLALEIHAPCSTTDPNFGKPGYIEAIISKTQQTYFARILGINFFNIPITARAEATRNLSPPCVYALDPTGANAISLAVGAIIQFKCAVVDESNSPLALANLVCALVSAPKVSVTGNAFSLLALGCPNVQTNVPAPTPADPLAYLPPPSNANAPCGAQIRPNVYAGSPKQVNITLGLLQPPVEFEPGVYCGGISINASVGGTITFDPVTSANPAYVLRDGPGNILSIGLLGIQITVPSPTPTGGLNIDVSALSTITGRNVMFYNEGSSVNAAGIATPGNASNSTPQSLGCLPLSPAGGFCITVPSILGLSNFSLSAPTSGEYGGVLFFQAHNVPTSNSFNSLLSGNPFDGAIYAPDATVNYAVNALSANNNILVAKDISFGTAGVLTIFGGADASSSFGSPLIGDDAVLVQ